MAKMEIGTRRVRKDGVYEKVAEGSWKKVKDQAVIDKVTKQHNARQDKDLFGKIYAGQSGDITKGPKGKTDLGGGRDTAGRFDVSKPRAEEPGKGKKGPDKDIFARIYGNTDRIDARNKRLAERKVTSNFGEPGWTPPGQKKDDPPAKGKGDKLKKWAGKKSGKECTC